MSEILRLQTELQELSDEALLRFATELRLQRARGRSSRRLRREIYAVAIEAIRRETGMQLRRVQIAGAIGLAKRNIIEMQTGEGKTLTAVPAVAYQALVGRGCHVVTSNPYLANRDAEQLRPIYARIGLDVGCVLPDCTSEQRRDAYRADITFATASEIGFDLLRDAITSGPDGSQVDKDDEFDPSSCVHRGFFAAIVDEADSVLIDDASTPLILGAETEPSEEMLTTYRFCERVVRELALGEDFVLEAERLSARLTEKGAKCAAIRSLQLPAIGASTEDILEQVERSLVAHHLMRCGKDYLIDDEAVVLVSGSTGRRLDGRKWQRGLHQAVEVKEGLKPTGETRTAAKITIQELFGLYRHLAGMTGTARSARAEFRRFYQLRVRPIPTDRPSGRRKLPTRVFRNTGEKHRAIVESVRKRLAEGRPTLIGTPSVNASELLAESFRKSGMEFQLLNANQDAHEAEIIATAGQPGIVTIATNMAGRGTDIKLAEEVRANGGLHVIATEVHPSRRIDRQLAGRCGRQGDPGTYELYLSPDDEIWKLSGRPSSKASRSAAAYFKAQRRLQREATRQRKKLFKSAKEQRKRLLDCGLDLYLETADD